MSHSTELFYVSVFSAALLLSAMGLWITAVVPGVDRWSKRFFLRYFTVFILCCVASVFEWLLYYYPLPLAAVYVILVLE